MYESRKVVCGKAANHNPGKTNFGVLITELYYSFMDIIGLSFELQVGKTPHRRSWILYNS